MNVSSDFEFPEDRERDVCKARRLEWLMLAYLTSVVLSMYFVLGSSQAMKSAWIEDLLSLIPPLAFLIADRIRNRAPNVRYPYGYHRAITIAFLFSAFSLLAMGLYLATDSILTLVSAQHPTIGGITLFGHTIWLGWVMIPVLVWSIVPAYFIGQAKLKVAKRLHDKCLYTDATMNKADWLTGVAAISGIFGIAIGWWWADAVAALLISFDIVKDGVSNSREVITDLMDRRPQTVDHRQWNELPDKIVNSLESLPWITSAHLRLRENGHVLFGEAFVETIDNGATANQVSNAIATVLSLDWRLHDVVIQIVSRDGSSTDE